MKTVFIHIGTHKTGSTYIQKVFAKNRNQLYKSGVDYPLMGAEFLFGHHNVAWSLMPEVDLQNTTDFSLASLSKYIENTSVDKVLLSSEEFDFFHVEHIKTLQESFANFDIRIVLFVRNPMNAFYSHWQECVKHGNTMSLQEYYSHALSNPHFLNYFHIAERWTQVFGTDAFTTVIYDNLMSEKIDIFIYFLQKIIEIRTNESCIDFLTQKINPANDIAVIEVLRHLNFIHAARGKSGSLAQKIASHIHNSGPSDIIRTSLELLLKDDFEYLDIQSLVPGFSRVESQFISRYGHRVMNAASNHHLFFPQDTTEFKLPLLDLELFKRTIDLELLYQDVMN